MTLIGKRHSDRRSQVPFDALPGRQIQDQHSAYLVRPVSRSMNRQLLPLKWQMAMRVATLFPQVYTDGCWTPPTSRGTTGYSRTNFNGRNYYAHRLIYEYFIAPVLPGNVVDHLCRNRACINPSHLEQVTNEENLRRGIGFTGRNFRTIECKYRHAFTPANTYITPSGERRCRKCRALDEYMRRRGVKYRTGTRQCK